MNKFLILGESIVKENLGYRGTYRAIPTYVTEMKKDSTINKMFDWYIQTGGQIGVVDDFQRAKKFAEAYLKLEKPIRFEVVRIIENSRDIEEGEELLGYDLSDSYHYSLLSWGLEIDKENDDSLRKIFPLLKLVKSFFKPKLNSNSLFQNIDDAQFCLDCLMALQHLRPNLWEGDEYNFEIVGLSTFS